MTYRRFEELPAWVAARELFVEVCRVTSARGFARRGDLRDQLERAALSVGNNVAEGFERGTTAELLMFLYIARGSAGEVRSALLFVRGLHEQGVEQLPATVLAGIDGLVARAEGVSRQIRAWAESLQNGDIRGPRHLTEQSKREYDGAKRADAFRKELAERQEVVMEKWQRGERGI